MEDVSITDNVYYWVHGVHVKNL